MDDRQRTIVEGAGLEESRLNQDFIDFLRKWGTPMLLLVVLAAGIYSGTTMWKRFQERAHNQAYADLHAAAVAGSPDNLVVVAEQHKGQGAVYELALIEAADAYLESARLGLRPGGDWNTAEDRLTDEQVKANLSRANDLYGRVVASTKGKPGHALHELNGLFGQAAVAESLGDIDAARATLTKAEEVAAKAEFPQLVAIAKERVASLGALTDLPPMYDAANVRSSGAAPAPASSPLNANLGGSLAPQTPPAAPATPADPFDIGGSSDNPLPTPPPGVQPQPESTPTP